MDWGFVGRAGTGRRPRGTKGLGVARASAEAATVGPQPRALVAPVGEVARGHALSGELWEPRRERLSVSLPSICPHIVHGDRPRRK